MDGDNVRVGEVRGCFRFLFETLPEILVARVIIPQNLDRHRAFQHLVHGLIDHGHPAIAKGFK